jgi:uncharacterized protein (DUF1499 family)
MCRRKENIYSCGHTKEDPIIDCIFKRPRRPCPRYITVTQYEKDYLCDGCDGRLRGLEDVETTLRNEILRPRSQNRPMYSDQGRERGRLREEIIHLRARLRSTR